MFNMKIYYGLYHFNVDKLDITIKQDITIKNDITIDKNDITIKKINYNKFKKLKDYNLLNCNNYICDTLFGDPYPGVEKKIKLCFNEKSIYFQQTINKTITTNVKKLCILL